MGKRKDSIQTNPNTIAVLHKLSRTWSVLVADMQGNKPRIVATDTFRSEESTKLSAFLDSQAPARVICVLPAASIICRNTDLPDVPEAQLAGVLSLQAEAHLMGIAPAHRISMAPLPAAAGETSRSGLVLAWPESATTELPALDRHIEYTGDMAGLAGLLGKTRPAEPMAIIDRHNGSLGIAMPHANGIRYRAACENSGDTTTWLQMVLRTFAETAINAGHTDGFIDSVTQSMQQTLGNVQPGEATLVIPADLMNTLGNQINGSKPDADWWSQFGIAAGVVMACHNGMESLTTIAGDPPLERPSRVLQMAEALSRPRTAIATVAACLALMAILPTLFTGLRLTALNVRHNDLQEQLRQVNKAEKQLYMYQLLADQAWPMSKLLSDFAANTPYGVELETIRITQGETITVAGKASPKDGVSADRLIAQMQQDLEKTRIFSEVTFSYGDRSNMSESYEFDLTARVVNAHRPFEYDDWHDFIKFSMQDRVDGKGPSTAAADDPNQADTALANNDTNDDDNTAGGGAETGPPPGALAGGNPNDTTPGNPNSSGQNPATVPNDDETGSARSRDRGRGGDGVGVAGDGGTIDSRGDGAATKVMPELLTEAQVAEMDRPEVMAALTEVANAKNMFRNDADAKTKLDGQFRMLMDRLKDF